MDDPNLQLTVAAMVIGGAGAFATAVVSYILGQSRMKQQRRRLKLLAKAKTQVVELSEQKIEIAQQKIDLEHHDNIITGYKDLLAHRQEAIDWVRKEVGELRDLVNNLRVQHATEVSMLKQQIEDSNVEKAALRSELNEVRARLQILEASPHIASAAVEHPSV